MLARDLRWRCKKFDRRRPPMKANIVAETKAANSRAAHTN